MKKKQAIQTRCKVWQSGFSTKAKLLFLPLNNLQTYLNLIREDL